MMMAIKAEECRLKVGGDDDGYKGRGMWIEGWW